MSTLRFVPDPLGERFINLVNIMFGVLISLGIHQYRENLLNLFSIQFLPSNLSLFAVYLIIFFSWYYYHRSIHSYPYNRTVYSRLRLIFDILILITYAYMLYGIYDPAILLMGSMIIFLLYFITGILRILEWKDGKVSNWKLNLIMMIIFAILYAFFSMFNLHNHLINAVVTISLVLTYRFVRRKWGYSKLIVVGVDIDGVLAEQVDHTLKWLRSKKGANLRVSQKTDIKKWDEEIAPGLTFDEAIENLLKEDEFFIKEMPVVIGSTKNMKEMYKKYHIVIASSRPPESERATKDWLSRHFKFHEYVNTRQIGKYGLGLHVLIDDNLENIKNFCKYGGQLAIIFDQPWNQQIDAEIQQLMKEGKVIRCKSWDEISEELDKKFSTYVGMVH